MKGYRFFMQDCKINILGSQWKIVYGSENEYPALKEMDGYMDSSTRTIVVDDMHYAEKQPGAKANMLEYVRQVTRHEIIHAFLFESGLDTSSGKADNWAVNEEMVDWFSIQILKIQRCMQEARVLPI